MDAAFAWLNPDSDGIWSNSPTAAVDELTEAVLTEQAGAVLIGTDEDCRTVIQSALEQLPDDRLVFHLHGSSFVQRLSYGALSILMARSEISPDATWHQVTKMLGGFLSPEGSEPGVVVLSQAHQMDRGSVTVLAQLAQQQRARLIVQCDRQVDLPGDLAALARTGRLAHVAVRPLTPAAAGVLLAAHLDAPVSRVATRVLWRYSGGHAGRLRKVAEDCLGTGKLHRVNGRLVLAAGPMPAGQGELGHDVALRRMSAHRRALLEVLASTGSVPVRDLVREGDGRELDALHDQGILQIRSTPDGQVAAVQPMWKDRVLGTLEPERRRELERLQEVSDSRVRQQVGLAEEHLASADVAGALAALQRAHEGHAESSSVRDEAWTKARSMAASGDLPSALDALDHPRPGRNAETVRFRDEAVRAEVLARSNDQEGARRAADWVDSQLSTFHRRGVLDSVMGTYDRAALAVSLLETHLLCGDLETCRALAEAVLTTRHGNPQAVLYAELVLAAVDLLSGRLESVATRAAETGEQAHALGDPHARAVAGTLVAYCRAVRNRDEGGPVESDAPGEQDDVTGGAPGSLTGGRLGWFAEVVGPLAGGRAAGAPIDRLMALAGQADAAGLEVVELHALLGAALLGSSAVADRLQEMAACTQSTLSGPSADLATAILDDDPAMFCTALTGLAAAGYAGWCHGGVTPVVGRLSPADARRVAEAVARQQEAGPDLAEDDTPGWMEKLTPREREVAVLVVDGLPNATVARRNGISVRTVEGHLYQIYAKLQVRGRSGLIRLAAQSAPLRAGR